MYRIRIKNMDTGEIAELTIPLDVIDLVDLIDPVPYTQQEAYDHDNPSTLPPAPNYGE